MLSSSLRVAISRSLSEHALFPNSLICLLPSYKRARINGACAQLCFSSEATFNIASVHVRSRISLVSEARLKRRLCGRSDPRADSAKSLAQTERL